MCSNIYLDMYESMPDKAITHISSTYRYSPIQCCHIDASPTFFRTLFIQAVLRKDHVKIDDILAINGWGHSEDEQTCPVSSV